VSLWCCEYYRHGIKGEYPDTSENYDLLLDLDMKYTPTPGLLMTDSNGTITQLPFTEGGIPEIN